MTALPQGNKSTVQLGPDGESVIKRYNDNGDPREKCKREVAFYRMYGASELLPPLLDSGEDWIRVGLVTEDRLSDVGVEDRGRFTRSYARALAAIFADAAVPDTAALEACRAGSARVTRNRVIESLLRYASAQPQSAILDAIRFSVTRVVLTRDLLIKLDWNSGNVFVADGRVARFIDFEQAYVGTAEMLTGAVLLNPDFDAKVLFAELANAGMSAVGAAEIVHYMNLAFAQVLLDSVQRAGRPWPTERLEEAYRGHVYARHIELMDG